MVVARKRYEKRLDRGVFYLPSRVLSSSEEFLALFASHSLLNVTNPKLPIKNTVRQFLFGSKHWKHFPYKSAESTLSHNFLLLELCREIEFLCTLLNAPITGKLTFELHYIITIPIF